MKKGELVNAMLDGYDEIVTGLYDSGPRPPTAHALRGKAFTALRLIEHMVEYLDEQAVTALPRLQLARFRKLAETHTHTDACLDNAARTGKAECIAPCADAYRDAVGIPRPGGVYKETTDDDTDTA